MSSSWFLLQQVCDPSPCPSLMSTAPSPPLKLRQVDSSVTTSSVRLQWDAPDPPNGNITHFKVTYDMHALRSETDMVVYHPSFSTFPSPSPSPSYSPSPPPPHYRCTTNKDLPTSTRSVTGKAKGMWSWTGWIPTQSTTSM